MNRPVFPVRGSDTRHAMAWGLVVAGFLVIAIFVGSRGLRDFDPALVSYAGASVFAAFGLGYRYSMWLRRPPTRLYWFRAWQIFLEPRRLTRNIVHLGRIFWNNIVLQRFIDRRSHVRWTAHWFLAWGCLLAAAVTFPLSFGWVRFETPRDSQEIYNAFMFGIPVGSFRLGTVVAGLAFNVLDIAAVMVLIGVFFAMWRRGRDRGAMTVQQFSNDLLPLILLFAISVTGLFLTASTHLMRGLHYVFLSQVHAVTVILTLLYLPFGKFFHIFQRPAQLGVDFYKRAGAEGPQALCCRCGEPYGSRLQMDDLKQVQAAIGVNYELADGSHYQDVCPACRRKNLALTQDGLWKATGADLRGY
ncbi:MAG TPA: MFS transporter [Clostridia bacterium]|nr:MFS transporter [Clostridia bacterium]